MTEQSKTWVITPEEDPETGDLIITFPPDLLELVGWKPGDTIGWNLNDDKSVYLTKKADK
jgi:hypothetical protein